MTACTNNGGSRARRAVTAALVGVLSVGAAPMVALATGAAPASGDVQLQVAGDPAFQGCTVYYSNGESGDSFVYNGGFQGLEPEAISYDGSTEKIPVSFSYNNSFTATGNNYFYVQVDQNSTTEFVDAGGNKVQYLDSEGDKTTLRGTAVNSRSATLDPGTYAVVVFSNDGGGAVARTIADTFTVVNAGLEGATLVDDGDVSDSTFEFTGKDGSAQAKEVVARLGVALDGVELTKNSDYRIDSLHEKGKNVDLKNSTALLEVDKTYVVEISGINGGYRGLKASLEFTFGQLHLDNVSVVSVGAVVGSAPKTGDVKNVVKELNGVAKADLNSSRFSVSVSGPDANGVYTYTISQSDSDKKGDNLVTGTATVQVAVGQQPASFLYSGAPIATGGQWGGTSGDYTYTYDMTNASQKPFDITKLTATTGSKDVTFTYTVQDAKTGASASVDNLDDRGEWIVTAVANGMVDGQRWVKCETVTVKNEYKLTDAANVYVSYDGKLVFTGSQISGTYDGTDLTDKVAVTVKSGDKTLVEGSDYEVEYTTKDTTGKTVKVDSVVDAGDYEMTVKGLTYDGTATYDFKVAQRTLSSYVPADPFASEVVDPTAGSFINPVGDEYTVYYYAYTGEEIAPEFSFKGNDGKTYTVPADEFEVTYKDASGNPADLKDKGTYSVSGITLKAKNFTGSPVFTASSRIVVTDASSFADVPNDAWYAEAVATAKQQGYIGGVGGSNLFAPMRNMSRADVVCVLYRMAGGTIDNEGMTDAEKTYISDFTDVDEGAYYAKAVSWAVKTGIARGYGDTFGTSRDVTTEEFATMLARYAASVGTDTSVDTDAVLAGVADGDQVSSYARDAVAWAVENGYVASNGNLIDPQGSVYRARVVTIAVRYQPEQLHVIL